MRTVLCFGDSNTHGTKPMAAPEDKGRYSRAERWPGVMAAALGPEWEVIAEGHPGRTTVHDDPIEGEHRNGLKALPVLLESHRPLDLVIVMLGTNDLKIRYSVTPGDIALGLERILRGIAGSGCGPDGGAPAVLLVSPVPVIEAGILAEMFTGGAEKSRALADRIGRMAARLGAGFFDAGTIAEVDPLDGVHLSAAAQAALGQALAEETRRMMG